MAQAVPLDDPGVKVFVDEAVRVVASLAASLAAAEAELQAHTRVFLDEGHRQRLDELILGQQAEMGRLSATIDRVSALADLAEWAADADLPSPPPVITIRVDDLRRALVG